MGNINLANKEIGDWGEQIAADYLHNHNVKIVDRNIRTNYGEIDIIGQKDGVLIFFEVKTRRTENFGNPEDAVNYIKKEHMKNSALEFIQSNQDMEMDCDTSWQKKQITNTMVQKCNCRLRNH